MGMRSIMILFLVAGMSSLISCSNESGEDIVKQQASLKTYLAGKKFSYVEIGDVYKVVKTKGYGYQGNYGDTVTFNYTITQYNSNVVITSNVLDTLVKYGFDKEIFKPGPTKVVIGQESFIPGIRQGLLATNAGEVADIYVTSDLGYGDQQAGIVPANTMLRIRMQILTINGVNIIAEKKTLADYLTSEAITATPTPEGFYFLETLAGSSFPKVGDTTYVSYVCKTLDGVVVSEVPASSNYEIILGLGKAPVVGLELALYKMGAGGSAQVILPSYLAYGKVGLNNLVQPYQTLIYDVNLISIKTKKIR